MIDALKHQLAAHQASLEANASELNEVTSNMDTVVAEIAKLKTQSDQLREVQIQRLLTILTRLDGQRCGRQD